MIKIDIFDNEERILINGICKNEKLSRLTKNDVLNALRFSRQITDENDSMMIDLIESTYEKVGNMSEAEWEKVKMLTPFPVVSSAEDEISANLS